MQIELQSLNQDDGFEQWSLSRPISFTELNQILHGAADPLISKNTLKILITITIPVPPSPIPTAAQVAEMEKQRLNKASRYIKKREVGNDKA